MHKLVVHRKTSRRGSAIVIASALLLPLALAVGGRSIVGAASAVRRLALRRQGVAGIATDVVRQRHVYDCGPAALANALRAIGITAPPLDSLARLSRTTVAGTRLDDLAAAARELGADVAIQHPRSGPGTIPASDAATSPRIATIALIDGGHFVTLLPARSGDAVDVLDPLAGRFRPSGDWLDRHWSGVGVVLERRGPQDTARSRSIDAAPAFGRAAQLIHTRRSQ